MPLFSKKNKNEGIRPGPPRRERSVSLFKKLDRRQKMVEQREGIPEDPIMEVFNPLTEFKTMSKADLEKYEEVFQIFDADGDGLLTLEEIKTAMRKLGTVMTHVEFKNIIKELDTDGDKCLDLREFISIFKKMQEGTHSAAMTQLVSEIEVSQVGVGGAKNFFEDKAKAVTESSFETELRKEKEDQEEKQKVEEEKRQKMAARANAFGDVKIVKKKEVEKKVSKLRIKKIKSRDKLKNNIESQKSQSDQMNLNKGFEKQGSISEIAELEECGSSAS